MGSDLTNVTTDTAVLGSHAPDAHQQLLPQLRSVQMKMLTVSILSTPMAPLAGLLPAMTHLTVYFLFERRNTAAALLFPSLAALPQLRLLRIILHEDTPVAVAHLQALAGLRQLRVR